MHTTRLISGIFFLLLTLGIAKAGTYNYRTIVPGERASGIGGAYTALANSAEGGFYNPAGLAFIDRGTLSVSGNLYNFTRGKRKGAITFAGSTQDLPQDAFSSVPQIASFAQKLRLPWEDETEQPQNAVALNVVVMELTDLTGRINFDNTSGQATAKRSIDDQTLLVGPSFARRLNDHLSFGLSMAYVMRTQEGTGFILEDSTANFTQAFLNRESTVGNLVWLLGARYSPTPNLWLGLTYMPPSLRLHSSGLNFLSVGLVDHATNQLSTTGQDDQNLKPKDEIPQRVTVGIAYENPGHWTVSGDVLIHMPNTFYSQDTATVIRIRQEPVINFSVGGEYFFTKVFVVRAGVFSNFSSAPDIQAGVTEQPDHVDHLGFTAALAMENENTSLSLGTVTSIGWGEGVDNLGNPITVESNSYGISLAGSYKF